MSNDVNSIEQSTSSQRQSSSYGVLGRDHEQLKARPTTYNGIRMRSRTEARYAEYLDCMGADWEYEPMCYGSTTGQYLPDFRIDNGPNPIYVEVKPTHKEAGGALAAMHIIRESEPTAILMVIVPDGLQGFSVARGCHNINAGHGAWHCEHTTTDSGNQLKLAA